jgi:hypothetical protein
MSGRLRPDIHLIVIDDTGQSAILVRAGNGHALFIHGKESVTQGDPLAIVAYGLPLIQLRRPRRASAMVC